MAESLVVGVDSSTTACKAIGWNPSGQAVGEGRASYPTLQPEPTWYEQDAEVWWTSLCAALKELLRKIEPAQLEALCITNQRESFVPVDEEGRPLRNAILWNDERCLRQLYFLEKVVGGERLHTITGKPLSMTPALPKMIWLVQNEPDVVSRCQKFLEPHAFLVRRLTGEYRTSLASADPMGLVDMKARKWSEDLIRELGFKGEQFPELAEPGEIVGRISTDAASATGLPVGLPVVAGGGDGQCAGLGTNVTGPDRAYLIMGTAVIGGAFSQEYRTDRAYRTLNAPIPGVFYLETCLKGGVFTVGWFIERFASELNKPWLSLSPEELLERAAAEIPPGSLGLMLVPYWHNVMSPYWDPAASGITVGWHGAHGPAHLYRAILEGIAFEQRLAGNGLMEALDHPFKEYAILGGGSKSNLWCQIMSDITGLRIVRSATTEATCLGAGILAAAESGWYRDIYAAAEAMTSASDSFEPDRERGRIYERLYTEVYRFLFPAVQPLVDRLTELTHDTLGF
jgi:sugar (pentulose or hexulose) kinase